MLILKCAGLPCGSVANLQRSYYGGPPDVSPMMHTLAKNILDVEIEVGRTVIWRAKDGDYSDFMS